MSDTSAAETTHGQSQPPSTARAGGIMMTSLFLSRVLGMLRNTVMTTVFGVSLLTDSYQLAVTIPDTLFMLVAGGGLSSAFIPVFSELLHTKREREAWKFFSVVVTVCSLAVTALIGVAWVLAPWIAHLMAADKVDANKVNISAQMEPHLVYMGRVLLPAQFAFLIGSILLGTLYSRRQFLAPGLAPNIYNVGIIVGAVVGGLTPLGIAGMPWGGLIGALLGNLLLPVTIIAKQGVRFRPSLDVKSEGVKRFFVLLAPVIFGFSLPSVCQIITNYFAARYPAGINTVLTLGNTLMQAPSGIFGQSLALAAFPVLAQFYANKRMDAYRSEMTKTIRTVLFLALPASAVMFALAPQIIQVLNGYGKSAHSANLAEVPVALRVYSIGIVAWCVQPVLMRGFFSAHKTLFPVALSTGMTALFIGMCEYCIHMKLPYTSLAWSTNIAAILLVFVLYWALQREVGKLDSERIFVTGVKALGGSLVMGAFSFAAFQALNLVGVSHSRIATIIGLLFVITSAVWIYYYLTRAMKMPETNYFERAFARINRSKTAPKTIDKR